MLEEGKPLRFGENKGIRLNGFDPEVVELGNGVENLICWYTSLRQ